MEEEFRKIDEENSWTALYQQIHSKAKERALPHKEARKACNVHLNRYKDVYPYDHSRICLQRADTNYINASLVPVPEAKRSYILTQGPLPTTASHFWAMVWEQKSKAIVMLNRIVEKNILKCHKYWPSCNEDEFIFEDISLKVINKKEEISTDYIIRHLMLIDLKTNESRLIYHFHYVTWPDFGVPETPEQFIHFLKIVRAKGVLDDISGPPVVHCSAGIGRSGTFCLVDSSLIMIKEGKNLDISSIKDLLLEMRRFRMGLIQTADQLRFSNLAIIEGAKSIVGGNKQPSLHEKLKQMSDMVKDYTEESSSGDSESKSSETPSEESISSGEEDIAFENERELTAEAEYPCEAQNNVEAPLIKDAIETEVSEESEDDSSDGTETETNPVDKSFNNTEMKNVWETEPAMLDDTSEEDSPCETSYKDINNLRKENQDSISSLDENPNDQILEVSDVSQQSVTCSLNNSTGGTNETVDTPKEIDTSNETANKNQKAFSTNVQLQYEESVINTSLNSVMPLSTENPEISKNSKLFDTSQRTNIHPCEDRRHCPSDSSSCFIALSNEEQDEDSNVGMISRHLEFYQNGDISSAKHYRCNTANENSLPRKDRNKSHGAKINKKRSSQCSHRSSSCPRKLPSVSSELPQSKNDCGVRKRRNSTESAHLSNEDGTVPLKFQKMYKNHRDSEQQIVEELVIAEDMHDTSCEDRPKESVLRSKKLSGVQD